MSDDVWAAAVTVSHAVDPTASDAADDIAWTPQELERAERLRRPEDRRSYLAAHRLVRTVAARALVVPASRLIYRQRCDRCGGTDHGRPWLQHEDRRVPVSVSHSRNAVACAVGARSTIDVEEISGFEHEVAGILSTSEESRAAGSKHPAQVRARLWTLKECLVKQGWTTLDELEGIDVMDAVDKGVFDAGSEPMRVVPLPVVGGDGAQVVTLLAPAAAKILIEEGV